MSGTELYFYLSGMVFHAVLVVLILLYIVIPVASYFACSFSFHNFYAKGVGKKFGWWAWRASVLDWMSYGGGGVTVRTEFGEWRGFGDYVFFKDLPIPEDAIVREEDSAEIQAVEPETDLHDDEREDKDFENLLEHNRRSHLKAPKRKPRPNLPPLKGQSK